MNEMELDIKSVLRKIKNNEISTKEGAELIKRIKVKSKILENNFDNQQTINLGKIKEVQKVDTIKGDSSDIQEKLLNIISSVTHLPIKEIDTNRSFSDSGIDSISGVEITRDINKEFDMNLDAVVLYDFSNIVELSKHILSEIKKNKTLVYEIKDAEVKEHEEKINFEEGTRKISLKTIDKQEEEKEKISLSQNIGGNTITQDDGKILLKAIRKENSEVNNKFRSKVEGNEDLDEKKDKLKLIDKATENNKVSVKENKDNKVANTDIAIIGLSCMYPDADNAEEFWDNLVNMRECIREVPKERWDLDKYYDKNPKVPNRTYSRWMGMLKNVDMFDPLFFNISPLEAELMDPQQRLFLQETWKALEDSGYSDKSLSGTRCGVYVGAANGDYEDYIDFNIVKDNGEAFAGLSTSILPGRVSYFLNLKGPSIAMDTACSSSLIAVYKACQSIWNNENDMAIAGGVRLMLTPKLHIQSSKAGMLSPTGKCNTFDNKADGIVLGEGVGVMILKPLNKALEDRDNIYGVIKGAGANQDGKTNGISAPSSKSQSKLETEVYKKFNINPETISFVETHGTGTKLGDPIEVKALKESFSNFTNKIGYCALSSVKANIGHTTMAAGVASIIKVLLAFKNEKIPGQVNFNEINEHINIENSPFYITKKTKEWTKEKNAPRRAVVSSFGFSGTNCHIVLEESPIR